MHVISFPENNITRYIPDNLSECDPQQYIDICELIFKYQCQKITYQELLTHSVYKLMNMKVAKNNPKTTPPDSNKEVNIILIQELIEASFFNIKEDGTFEIILNYIDNPIPFFKPLWQTYYGPTNGFMNIKFGEYTDALRLFLEFNTTGEIKLLYDLAATLYRKKNRFHFILKNRDNYDGDCRRKYNQHHLESRAKTFQYAPLGFIYGIYLYFASFQKFVSSAEVPWGDKTLNLSILFESNNEVSEIEASDIGLDSVLFAMAETGAFGDFEKVQNTPFWTIMIRMYDSKINNLKQEKLQENANSQSPS